MEKNTQNDNASRKKEKKVLKNVGMRNNFNICPKQQVPILYINDCWDSVANLHAS